MHATDVTTESETAGESTFDLVDLLLEEQQQLSAVELFARQKESGHCELPADRAPDQAKYYRSLLPASSPTPEQQFAFEVDLDACSGCKACVVACHTLNGLEEDETWRSVGGVIAAESAPASGAATDGLPIAIGVRHVTTACHHCEDPGCLNGCPVKAYDKDPVTGIVRHLDDQCIGCKYCTMMCPYEVPKYSKRLGIVRKCDMCYNRLAVGEAPACVQSCPNEAIEIRLVDRSLTEADRKAAGSRTMVAGAPSSSLTLPTTRYVSQAEWNGAAAMDLGIDEVSESHWPLAALLVATQIGVGMVLWDRVSALISLVAGNDISGGATPVLALVALLVSGIGLNLAPLHLGQPLRAWRVFLGLRTSWLSREAVVLGKFVGALALACLLISLPSIQAWLPESINESIENYIPTWAGSALLWASLPLGVVGLYCSAMIYIATGRIWWRFDRTMVRFAGTFIVVGLIGTLAVAALMQLVRNDADVEASSLALMLGSIAALGLVTAKFVYEWRVQLAPSRSTDDAIDLRSRRLTIRSLSKLRGARILAFGISAASLLVATIVIVTADAPTPLVGMALGTALVAAAGGDMVERLLYFMAVVHDRMPGIHR
ncbi:DmsC/YnfH family molybdoenzyme membrane anchor subunit [Crateriforma spongiae]|uniref:DmsC/YnfH family molybdoenzyme membrane anchor subunit n=1 Tax=Crateriforma spongiae TaxID=2724528 RepID=UPI0014452EE8|nr:DmsC/YnfH family molybdoenzyme membrane anchor subunit [Crateriforma spongiae]